MGGRNLCPHGVKERCPTSDDKYWSQVLTVQVGCGGKYSGQVLTNTNVWEQLF